MMLSLRSLLLLASCALTAAAACANQVRFADTVSDREVRAVLETRYVVEPAQGTVDRTRLRLAFAREETIELRVEKTVTRTEELTPYQGVRELYEVPAGLVSVPLSLALNAADLALLGSLPSGFVYGFTSWSFAALNPFLNAESRGRIESRELSRGPGEIKRSQQTVRSPLA